MSANAATERLLEHLVTGQHDIFDQHLGALMAWIEPPMTKSLLDEVERIEVQPFGRSTDPRQDRELDRRLRRYQTAAKIGDTRPDRAR